MAEAQYTLHLEFDLILAHEGKAEELPNPDIIIHVMDEWLDNLLVDWARGKAGVSANIANLEIS